MYVMSVRGVCVCVVCEGVWCVCVVWDEGYVCM